MAKTKKFNTTIKLHDLTFEYSPIANKPSTMTVSLDGNSINWTDSDSVKKTLMLLEDFATNGKIRADKIEALGLTEVIVSTESSIQDFAVNHAAYTFEKNDMIAIENAAGSYDLFIYVGLDKTLTNNYILTGLTNVTISMVQGLQDALDSKQNALSCFDESLLIESDGNIENNVSLFSEYYNQQNCILNFIPIQIVGVYKNGLKLNPSEYTIILPKTISINTYVDEDIEIQYTHLKNILI